MSLQSVCSISSRLPVVFLEARMHGTHQAILSQLGFSIDLDRCSIALFSRTSGIVLVAGVGSYLAYRIFAKFLGNRFLWTIVDFTRTDLLNRADLRFFCRQAEEEYKKHDLSVSLIDQADFSEWGSFCDGYLSDSTEVTYLSPESSPMRCHRWIVSHSPCDEAEPASDPVTSREPASLKSSKGSGRNVDRRLSTCASSAVLRRLSEVSAAASEQSSSIRLQWDDPSWDTQSEVAVPGIARRCQSLSPSDVSEFSEFRAARRIFDDLSALNFDDTFGVDEGYMDATPTGDESTGSISEAHDFIEKNCMTDSKHLYHIVSGCSPGSDNFSVCSSYTTHSFLSLRNCAASTSLSSGLLDLTQSSISSSSAADTSSTSMTDSAISRGSASTGDERWCANALNEIPDAVKGICKTPVLGSLTPHVEEDELLCTVKKWRPNCSHDHRRLCIVRRTDLYDDDDPLATPVVGRRRKQFEAWEDEVPSTLSLFEEDTASCTSQELTNISSPRRDHRTVDDA